MLSDEEKKAIEWLKKADWFSARLYAPTILNLIEKQSKEIEKRANQRNELAILNAKQIEFNKLVNTVNSYKGQFKRQQKELEELKEKNEYLPNWVSKKYVSKDKIKAKIEYLLKRYDSEEDFCSYDVLISILQSLLEKE